MSKLTAFISVLSFFQIAYGHGSLELIECHDKSNGIVFRGEALNKKNDFKFKMTKSGKKVWSHKKIRLKLRDTVEDQKLFENIEIEDGKGNKAHLKIEEIASREIRNGTGHLKFPNLVSREDLLCYAVY